MNRLQTLLAGTILLWGGYTCYVAIRKSASLLNIDTPPSLPTTVAGRAERRHKRPMDKNPGHEMLVKKVVKEEQTDATESLSIDPNANDVVADTNDRRVERRQQLAEKRYNQRRRNNKNPVIKDDSFLLGENVTAAQAHRFPNLTAQTTLPRILAIYFPQYHSDPLNDRLWGKGFTDWDNLRKAPERNRKEFLIPRPTDFGYYDLMNKTVRKLQSDLARKYGIDGFVYHHYWFYDPAHPGPNLHAPLMKMLDDGYPNLPFCLHWVPENWTATWHRNVENDTGIHESELDNRILQQQFLPESSSDDRITEHYKWLRQFFTHEKYIKVNGRPVFMIYGHVPGVPLILRRLNALAVEDDFPGGLFFTVGQYASHTVLFPQGVMEGLRAEVIASASDLNMYDRITNYPFPFDWTRRESMQLPEWCRSKSGGVVASQRRSNELIGVVTTFDNTPRREFDLSRIWQSDRLGGEKHALQRFEKNVWVALYYHACCFEHGDADQFILINSWNEWAEGMMLEPSNVYGVAFLELLHSIKKDMRTCTIVKRRRAHKVNMT